MGPTQLTIVVSSPLERGISAVARCLVVSLLFLVSCKDKSTDPDDPSGIRYEKISCNSYQDPYEWSVTWDLFLQVSDAQRIDPASTPGYTITVVVRRHRYTAANGDVAESWVEWPSVGGNRYVIDGVNGKKSGGEYWRWEMRTTIGTSEEPEKHVSKVVWVPDIFGCVANPS